MVELSSIIDKFGVYIYKNPLIWFRAEVLQNWKHRELAIEYDPIANAYICKLDEEILTEDPIFEPDILADPKIKKEWVDEGWQDFLITIMNAARTHRWCIPKLYDREPYWRVFTWREVKEIHYDKYDIPYKAIVEWTPDLPANKELTEHKETINFNKDVEGKSKFDGLFVTFGGPSGRHIAKCDLDAIWDLMIYARYQMLDIINNSAKTSGFWHIIYGDSISDDQTSDLKNAFDYTGVGQAIGAKKRVIEDIVFHTPDHPEFTITALEETLKLISGNTRLPLAFYIGTKEGGGVFQEGFSDEAKTNSKKKYVFGQFKKTIIDLVRMRWGKEITDVQPYIKEDIEMDTQMERNAESNFTQDHFGKDKGNENKQKVKKIA
jgi:hypothetical protein